MSEQHLRELIDSGHFRSLNVVPRFTRIPVVEAVRGYDNREYNAGLKNRTKLLMRQLASRALPWLWI
jgi:hypothetical protein